MKPVVMFSQRRGGAGKSTNARYFSEFCVLQGLRVCTIELDGQCNISRTLLPMEFDSLGGARPPIHPDDDDRYSSADLVDAGIVLPYPVDNPRVRFNLDGEWDIIPAHADRIELAQNLVVAHERRGAPNPFKYWFSSADVQETYDIFVVDTPPTVTPLLRSMLAAASHVAVPFSGDLDSEQGLYQIMGLLVDENRRRYAAGAEGVAMAGVVFNMYERVDIHQALFERLGEDEAVRPYLIDTPIPKSVFFTEANQYDPPAPGTVFGLRDSRRKHLREAYLAVCAELYRRILGVKPKNLHRLLDGPRRLPRAESGKGVPA